MDECSGPVLGLLLTLDSYGTRPAPPSRCLRMVLNGELTMKTLALVVASALGGALVVVACSDDSPTPADADAGSCNCPAAEPPIVAGRLHRVDSTVRTVPLASSASASAECPTGELLLGGSCYIDQDETAQQVALKESGIVPREATSAGTVWNCLYGNQSTVGTAMVRAQALCLRP